MNKNCAMYVIKYICNMKFHSKEKAKINLLLKSFVYPNVHMFLKKHIFDLSKSVHVIIIYEFKKLC